MCILYQPHPSRTKPRKTEVIMKEEGKTIPSL